MDTSRLIKSVSTHHEWMVKPSSTVLALGPLTLQMKGSGKKASSAYHSMQFNASIKEIIDDCPEAVVSQGPLTQITDGIFKNKG